MALDDLRAKILGGNSGDYESGHLTRDDDSVLNNRYWLDIDTEDIFYMCKSAMVLNDVLKTVGTLQQLYSEIIHPAITYLYNGLDGDYDRLASILNDDELSDRAYDFMESRYYTFRTIKPSRDVKVTPDDVLSICTVILDLVLPRIVDYTNSRADEYINEQLDSNDIHVMVQIEERCEIQSIPSERDPRILRIGVSCFVVHT